MWAALPRLLLKVLLGRGQEVAHAGLSTRTCGVQGVAHLVGSIGAATRAQARAARRGEAWVPLAEADAILDDLAARFAHNQTLGRAVELAKESIRRSREQQSGPEEQT